MQQMTKVAPAIHRLSIACATVVPAILTASIASAEIKDWSSTAATSAWDTGTNWDGGTAPANSGLNTGDTPRFNQTSYLSEPNLTASRSVRNLLFGDGTTTTAALTLSSNSSAEILTIGNSTSGGIGSGGIDIFANAGAVTLSAPISLGVTQTWTNNSANLFTIGNVNISNRGLTITGTGDTLASGAITATNGPLTKQGAGTLKFGSTNVYSSTGILTVSEGTLDLNGFSQTLANRVINSATITNSSNTAVTLTIGNNSSGAGAYTGKMDVIWNNVASNGTITGGFANTGNVTFNATSTGNLNLTTSAINNIGTVTNSGAGNGTTTITASIGTNVSGVIQNSATSNLAFSGDNSTWTSGLLIKSGTVNLGNNVNAAGAATNVLTIGDAAIGANATLNTTASAGAGAQPIVVAAGAGTRTISNSGAPNPTFSGLITMDHDLILVNNSAAAGGSGLTFSGGITGTGNLLVQGNSTNATPNSFQGIQLTAGDGSKTVNPLGTITNAGTGAHDTIISASIGTNVTGITQNSATSRLILSGLNTYTAPTTVTLGTLELAAGGVLANGNITVASGGIFQTEGQTGGTTEVPEITPASILTFNIDDATTFDALDNAGVVNLAGDLTLDFASLLDDATLLDLFVGSGSYSSSVEQVSVTGAYSGSLTPSGSVFSGTFGNQEIAFNAATGDLTIAAAVPEPASMASLALGAAGLLLRRRRTS